MLVIVTIPCGKLHLIMVTKTIPSCPRVSTEVQLVVDAAPLHVEVAVPRVLPHSVTVVHVNVELSPPLGGSEAMYLLQTQPMFTVELAKAIDIVLSLSVKVLRSVHESLECIPRLKRQLMLIGGIHN